MKVSYVTMRFPVPTETFACTDVRTLRKFGVEVTVHTLLAPTANPETLLAERGLHDVRVSHGGIGPSLVGMLACLRRPVLTSRLILWLATIAAPRPKQLLISLTLVPRAMGILATLEREKPDVVHLFWGHYPCIVGFLVLKALPRTVLSLFLGAYDLTRPFGASSWVAKRADLVSTHARWNFPVIEALGVRRDEIHLAYRGIDPVGFRGSMRPRIARRIISVGRLECEKGVYDVLRIFAAIHGRWPDATLRLLGDGPERRNLQHLSHQLHIESAVSFLGHVTQTRVAQEMAEAQVLLHMSYEETLPNVVKEAMASGCMCVVTQTYGIEELIVDQEHGFVVPPRDIDAAVSRIQDVFAARIDVAAITTSASAHIARSFSVDRSMQSYIDCWHTAQKRRQHHHHDDSAPSQQPVSRTSVS